MESQINILNPSISLYGWEIREPVTSITDFFTALVCLYAFIQLSRIGRQGWIHMLFRTYFALMTIGMCSAAFAGHAFQAYLSTEWKMMGWILAALALMCLEWIAFALNKDRLPQPVKLAISVWIPVHFLLFLTAISLPEIRNFSYVKINSTVALMGVVMPLMVFYGFETRHPGSRWIILAILWGILPAIVYNFEISLGRWFNYHDISHILMATYSFMLYKGGRAFAIHTDQHLSYSQ